MTPADRAIRYSTIGAVSVIALVAAFVSYRHALQVVRAIGGALERAVADGSDLDARSEMLLAAHVAGIAQGMTGLGLGHAIAHPLGGRLDVPHGVALAAVLPAVMRFNAPVVRDRLSWAAVALGVAGPRDPGAQAADAAVREVARLIAAVGLGGSLGSLGVTRDLVTMLADDALADVVVANTPRMPSRAEVRELVVALL